MSTELRIVEHKDCLRCFQPIDERAELCPFCSSLQTKPNRNIRSVLAGMGLVLTFLVVYLWFSLDRERREGLEITNELVASQGQLNSVRSATASYLSRIESLQSSRLDAANVELAQLIKRAQSNTTTVSTLCDFESILGICSKILNQTTKDTIALAELMGRFEALGFRGSFCDQVRPVLKSLVRISTNRIGADMHNSYYLATSNCWRSK